MDIHVQKTLVVEDAPINAEEENNASLEEKIIIGDRDRIYMKTI